MKDYRIEIHLDGIVFMRSFDDEADARRGAREAYRDGARSVYIQKRNENNQYEHID